LLLSLPLLSRAVLDETVTGRDDVHSAHIPAHQIFGSASPSLAMSGIGRRTAASSSMPAHRITDRRHPNQRCDKSLSLAGSVMWPGGKLARWPGGLTSTGLEITGSAEQARVANTDRMSNPQYRCRIVYCQ
jgi:hypothetical protein